MQSASVLIVLSEHTPVGQLVSPSKGCGHKEETGSSFAVHVPSVLGVYRHFAAVQAVPFVGVTASAAVHAAWSDTEHVPWSPEVQTPAGDRAWHACIVVTDESEHEPPQSVDSHAEKTQ